LDAHTDQGKKPDVYRCGWIVSALGYVSPEEFERAYVQRTMDDFLTNQERA
jgi:hypothetical protein